MKDRIEIEESGRSGLFGARSHILFEIGLWCYAIISGIIVSRIIILALNARGEIWVVRFVQTLTGPVANVLKKIPGGNSAIIGILTVADLTLLMLVVLVPLVLIAFGRSTPARHQL